MSKLLHIPFLTKYSTPFSGFLLNKFNPIRYFRFLMTSDILNVAMFFFDFGSLSFSTSFRFHSEGDAPRSEKFS